MKFAVLLLFWLAFSTDPAHAQLNYPYPSYNLDTWGRSPRAIDPIVGAAGRATACRVSPALPSMLVLGGDCRISFNEAVLASYPSPFGIAVPTTAYRITGTYGGVESSYNLTLTVNSPQYYYPILQYTATSYVIDANGNGESYVVPRTSTAGPPIAGCDVSPSLPASLIVRPDCSVVFDFAKRGVVSPLTLYRFTPRGKWHPTYPAAMPKSIRIELRAGYSALPPVSPDVPPEVKYEAASIQLEGASDSGKRTLTPTVIGGKVTGCLVTPSLPSGMTAYTDCSIEWLPWVGGYSIPSSNTNISIPTYTHADGRTCKNIHQPGAMNLFVTRFINPATYSVQPLGTAGRGPLTPLTLSVRYPAPKLTYSVSAYSSNPGACFTLHPVLQAGAGPIAGCTSSAPLPTGFTLNSDCTISASASAAFPLKTFTITASNPGGSSSTSLALEVVALAPPELAMRAQLRFTVGSSVNYAPRMSGGAPSDCTISPALPAGLSFDRSSCRISGTPMLKTPALSYLIAASNPMGYRSANFQLQIVPESGQWSPAFQALNALNQQKMLSSLRAQDASVIASQFFVGQVPACAFSPPRQSFTVPATGSYHVTSYVRAGPSSQFLSPEFSIEAADGAAILRQSVSNQIVGGNSTFYLKNSYRVLDLVSLEAGKTYFLRQKYDYLYFGVPGQTGSEYQCPDKLAVPALVDLGILVVRKADLVDAKVAQTFGYADVARFLEASGQSTSQQTLPGQTQPQWVDPGLTKNFDPFASSGFDSLSNLQRLFEKENWIQRQALDSEFYDAYLSASGKKNACVASSSCFFTQMPLLNQGFNSTCGGVASAMLFAGLLGESTPVPGRWFSTYLSRLVGANAATSKSVLAPNGVAVADASPEMRAILDLTGYLGLPSYLPNASGERWVAPAGYSDVCQLYRLIYSGAAGYQAENPVLTEFCIQQEFLKLGVTKRMYDFTSGKEVSTSYFPSVNTDWFKSRLLPGNKFAMNVEIRFTKVVVEQGLGLTNVRFEVESNFRNSGKESTHALTVNGYSGDNLLLYNPWELEHYMKVKSVSVGQGVEGSPSSTNMVLSLPGGVSSGSYLKSFNWADGEFHPESYYWFVTRILGVAAQ